MTETMLTALDKQMALSDTARKPRVILCANVQHLDKYLVMMTLDQGIVEPHPCQLLGKSHICLLLKITK